MKIPFNKPHLAGNEIKYIRKAAALGKLSGNGHYTNRCHAFFTETYGFKKVLLTSSGTAALEMAAILAGVGPGDEVVVPSFSFVSDANAFALRGADIVFADSNPENPNIDPADVAKRITPRTKALLVVHYGGMACDMDPVMRLASERRLCVIEDAAQAIDSFYKGKPLGSIGRLGAFSFHETKNIISGEGGLLTVNDLRFSERSEIVWEKGTNRTAMFRGEIDQYEWIDIGSSFLPSEITAAFLYAQLEKMKAIQKKRLSIWNRYRDRLRGLEERGLVELPRIPAYATHNGHLFYLVCRSKEERTNLIEGLRRHSICAIFHYLALHRSPYARMRHAPENLPNAEKYADRLVRLPLFSGLKKDEQEFVIRKIKTFYALK
jgi:dTDP-4-amino-4,6-dideoxygalactose transaminase